MKKKIGIVSLGCPKNLVDTEIMLGLLKNEQYEITADEKEAQIIIVNTCGFIESAIQESINSILEMAELKKEKCELLIVTGCMAERYKGEIIRQIPEVDAVIGTGNYNEIVKVINLAYRNEKPLLFGKPGQVDYLENERVITTGKSYAYLKIAEGCDNCCTYCIIPSLRGPYRSRSIDSILKEAARLAKEGIREVILVAQDTTRYGLDIYGQRKLPELIRKISEIDGIEWIRLLYCYPEDITGELIKEIAENSKVCKYIDIPIQHASDKLLKLMGRRGRRQDIERIIMNLRQNIPDIVIRTSLIVGFPGEDEEDFAELYDFVGNQRFDRLGVFVYSKEEGTPAAKMKQQVPRKVKQERYDKLMELQKSISEENNQKRIGKCYRAVVEGIAEDGIFYYGRTYAETPDIDGIVYFTTSRPLEPGERVNIKILNADCYDLIGDVIDEPSQ